MSWEASASIFTRGISPRLWALQARGKSTLLYCLSGMDAPTSGEVIFEGEDIARLGQGALRAEGAALRVRLSGGEPREQPHLYENIAVPGYLKRGRSASETKRATDELVARMGLAQVASHLPSQASGGQKQRCAVARAVVNEPAIVFADEPTGALNRANSLEVLDLLGELNRDGISILMVTHDVRSAVRGNRVLYFEDGASAVSWSWRLGTRRSPATKPTFASARPWRAPGLPRYPGRGCAMEPLRTLVFAGLRKDKGTFVGLALLFVPCRLRADADHQPLRRPLQSRGGLAR